MRACLEKKIQALYQLAQQERHAEARLREQVFIFVFLCDLYCVLFVVVIVQWLLRCV